MVQEYSVQAEGNAAAAFLLAQLAFWHQINTGQLTREKAAEMLSQAVATSLELGGPGNFAAAQRLKMVLEMVTKTPPPDKS